MKNETKISIIGVIILAALFRAALFADSQAEDSLKFLLGVSIAVFVYAAVDSLFAHMSLKKDYESKRLQITHEYYNKMIELERNDPRRLKDIQDVDEVMALYNHLKTYNDQKGSDRDAVVQVQRRDRKD